MARVTRAVDDHEAAATGTPGSLDHERAGIPQQDFQLPELDGPVEILVDSAGVPHIYAGTILDAFRAQGFNVARERLWQIDTWLRKGLGRLAEVHGTEFVDHDHAARHFLFRGDMTLEWEAYGPQGRATVEAFVEGINAYVSLVDADRDLLPREFTALGYTPTAWSADDIVRIRASSLAYNVQEEVRRAHTLSNFGERTEDLRRVREPAGAVHVPQGLDLDAIPDDVLRIYDLALERPDVALNGDFAAGIPEGSNNWALAPDRTATGRPIMANDPHRALTQPSLRYVAHLVAPGLNVIGAGEPAIPGIAIGHNEDVAFGLTIFPADQEDLYVYEIDRDDDNRYKYAGAWESMVSERVVIDVRDNSPVEREVRFTRHGPVVHVDTARGLAYAIRAAWLQPGGAPYLGSLRYLRARTVDEFTAAVADWVAPPVNHVCADVAGDIAHQAAGLVPDRPNWDGTLPVPGDGRYEWRGFVAAEDLPSTRTPERGWVASANEMNLAPNHPHDLTLTRDWYAPYRSHRIRQVLEAGHHHTLAQMADLQADVTSLPAQAVLARLKTLNGLTGCQDLSLLRAWDGVLDRESAAATLFEVWYRGHLRPSLLEHALAQELGDRAASALPDVLPVEDLVADARIDLEILEHPQRWLGSAGEQVLVALINRTLAEAAREVARLLGPDRAAWRWGDLHHATFVHPLLDRLDSPAHDRLAETRLRRGGSGDTVCDTTYGPGYRQLAGSTFRIVMDVGHWDDSRFLNAPGQSARETSEHFDDLVQPWADDTMVPLHFTRTRVEQAATTRILLRAATTFR